MIKDTSLQAVESCHDLIKWMLPQIDRFPRVRRYSIGSHLEQCLIDSLEQLVEAAWTREKRAALQQANRRLRTAQHLWRLAMELKLVSMRRYRHGAGLLIGVGRQTGGWQKASAS